MAAAALSVLACRSLCNNKWHLTYSPWTHTDVWCRCICTICSSLSSEGVELKSQEIIPLGTKKEKSIHALITAALKWIAFMKMEFSTCFPPTSIILLSAVSAVSHMFSHALTQQQTSGQETAEFILWKLKTQTNADWFSSQILVKSTFFFLSLNSFTLSTSAARDVSVS